MKLGEAQRRVLVDKFSQEHVSQEGARFHVHSYTLLSKGLKEHAVTWCGEAFCEHNRRGIFTCIEMGIDPAKVIPSVEAKEWLRSPAGLAALKTGGEDG